MLGIIFCLSFAIKLLSEPSSLVDALCCARMNIKIVRWEARGQLKGTSVAGVLGGCSWQVQLPDPLTAFVLLAEGFLLFHHPSHFEDLTWTLCVAFAAHK